MKQLFPRGKRIRPTDKDLVFHTALAALFPVFLLVVLLFHIRQIAGTNWQEVSLSQITQDVKQIKGRGYVDVGTSVISEFYTPLVPKGHDFLKEIKKLIDSRQGVQAACEAKAAETD